MELELNGRFKEDLEAGPLMQTPNSSAPSFKDIQVASKDKGYAFHETPPK